MAQRNRKREPAERPIAPDGSDWVVVILAAAGLAVTGYLSWLKLTGGGAAFCVRGSGCDIVQSSRYALFLGVPTALWGFLLYAALGVLGWMGLNSRNWQIAFALAAGGVGFSAYMTCLSLFVVEATCVYCLASAAVAGALLAALLWRRPSVTGRKSPFRPVRLATLGAVSAAAAVFVGAFVFAAPSSPPGYQLALARHLVQTKAVFYGAFW